MKYMIFRLSIHFSFITGILKDIAQILQRLGFVSGFQYPLAVFKVPIISISMREHANVSIYITIQDETIIRPTVF